MANIVVSHEDLLLEALKEKNFIGKDVSFELFIKSGDYVFREIEKFRDSEKIELYNLYKEKVNKRKEEIEKFQRINIKHSNVVQKKYNKKIKNFLLKIGIASLVISLSIPSLKVFKNKFSLKREESSKISSFVSFNNNRNAKKISELFKDIKLVDEKEVLKGPYKKNEVESLSKYKPKELINSYKNDIVADSTVITNEKKSNKDLSFRGFDGNFNIDADKLDKWEFNSMSFFSASGNDAGIQTADGNYVGGKYYVRDNYIKYFDKEFGEVHVIALCKELYDRYKGSVVLFDFHQENREPMYAFVGDWCGKATRENNGLVDLYVYDIEKSFARKEHFVNKNFTAFVLRKGNIKNDEISYKNNCPSHEDLKKSEDKIKGNSNYEFETENLTVLENIDQELKHKDNTSIVNYTNSNNENVTIISNGKKSVKIKEEALKKVVKKR